MDRHNIPLLFFPNGASWTTATLWACVLFLALGWIQFTLRSSKSVSKENQADSNEKKKKSPKKREICTCPFSNQATFVIETAEDSMAPTPMDRFKEWTDHLGLRWLAAGTSGQDQPGFLRAALKRFRHHQHFLLEDKYFEQELSLKAKAYDKAHAEHFVMEEDSIAAQQETLELFLAYLPKRYPEKYVYDKESHSIKVALSQNPPKQETYRIDDWKERPLELCGRIVQEDLVLMRETTDSFRMAAAAVVFSFNDLPTKLGTDTNFIHAPVPGFTEHLSKVLYITFRNIKVEKPLWRNNWIICPSGRLDEPSDSLTHYQELSDLQKTPSARDRYVKVEYQTIRRLPSTGYLLFTVRTFTDPVWALEQVPPKAAQTLAESIRGMTSLATLEYRGIESDEARSAILEYLDSIG